MINWEELESKIPFSRDSGRIVRRNDTVDIEILMQLLRQEYGQQLDGNIDKRIKLNGSVKRASQVLGQVKVVLFSHLDIDILCGAPILRRRYVDSFLCQINAEYLRSLQKYQKVLLQRNNLLKLIAEGKADRSQLEFWDTELITKAVYITNARIKLIRELSAILESVHSQLSGSEVLGIRYVRIINRIPVADTGQECDMGNLKEIMGKIYENEVMQGMTLAGPHRDDIRFSINGRDVSIYCSRGQQRTAAISLRLSEASYIDSYCGDNPVLLMDDLFSELDTIRRKYIQEFISPYQQVIFTCADINHFDAATLHKAKLLKVTGNSIEPANP